MDKTDSCLIGLLTVARSNSRVIKEMVHHHKPTKEYEGQIWCKKCGDRLQ
jgi:hypothetical protein